MAEAVDHNARTQAALAIQQIESHEKQCAERWAEARDAIKGLSGRCWWLIGLVVTGQGAVILTLVAVLTR